MNLQTSLPIVELRKRLQYLEAQHDELTTICSVMFDTLKMLKSFHIDDTREYKSRIKEEKGKVRLNNKNSNQQQRYQRQPQYQPQNQSQEISQTDNFQNQMKILQEQFTKMQSDVQSQMQSQMQQIATEKKSNVKEINN